MSARGIYFTINSICIKYIELRTFTLHPEFHATYIERKLQGKCQICEQFIIWNSILAGIKCKNSFRSYALTQFQPNAFQISNLILLQEVKNQNIIFYTENHLVNCIARGIWLHRSLFFASQKNFVVYEIWR